MNCAMEPIQREQTIAKYLSRSLDSEAVEEFEGHYLGCDELASRSFESAKLWLAHLRQSDLSHGASHGGISVLQIPQSGVS